MQANKKNARRALERIKEIQARPINVRTADEIELDKQDFEFVIEFLEKAKRALPKKSFFDEIEELMAEPETKKEKKRRKQKQKA